jgi:hypothetical protein
MNPNAMAFDPNGTSPAKAEVNGVETNGAEAKLSYDTLVHCLEDEQDRHNQTKIKLSEVSAYAKDLEQKNIKLESDKASLINTANTLAAIVKRNVANLEKGPKAVEAEKHAAAEAKNGVGPDKKNESTCATESVTAAADTQPAIPVKSSSTDTDVTTAGPTTPDTALNNTPNRDGHDVNKTTNVSSSGKSDLPRGEWVKLKFDSRESSSDFSDTGVYWYGKPKKAIEGDKTEENTEEDKLEEQKIEASYNAVAGLDTATKEDSVVSTPRASTQVRHSKLPNSLRTDALQDDKFWNGGQLVLNRSPDAFCAANMPQPAEILSKYGKKPDAAKKSNDDDSSVNDTNGSGKPSTSLATSLHSLNANGPKIVDTAAPYELSIKWSITQENPIFEDDEDLYDRLPHPNSRREVFWRHPVRYLEHDSKNIFRTVMIDHIPGDATYFDVVQEISAGSLEKIEMVPAIGSAAKFQTARVVFNFELGASTTANFARDHGIKIKGQPVRVWQVLTQTYPKNNTVEEWVYQNGFTRVLIINNATQQALSMVPTKLKRFRASIVEFSQTFDRYPLIEFTSVATAVQAMKMLMNDHDFRGAEFDFDEDPCGEPYPFAY